MQFLGKIFVVLQLVLSVLLMAFAAAVFSAHENWKEKTSGLETTLAKTNSDMQTLQTEYDKYRTDTTAQLDGAKSRADHFEAANAGLTGQLQALNERFATQAAELQAANALAKINLVEAKTRRDEALSQRDVNKALHQSRDEINRKRQTLEDELFAERLKNDEADQKVKDLLGQNGFFQRVIREHKLETDQKLYEARTTPPPPVEGVVITARKGRGTGEEYVALSIGSDDGLVPGHSLDVYRMGGDGNGHAKYLGKIEIVETYPDQAVGKVVERAKNGTIQEGDNVTTKL